MSRAWAGYLTVFLSSGCGLALEIIAGRILTPLFGVSLYTWTSVIGVVLAGISAGNFSGGVVADRWPVRRTLGSTLAAAGLSCLAVPWLIQAAAGYHFPASVPLLARIVLLTLAGFLPPSLFLGMVSPIVIKLSLQQLDRAGSLVGQVYAVSTAGAILGAFLTGFLLIHAYGTRIVAFGLGLTLLALAMTAGGLVSGTLRSSVEAVSLVGACAVLIAGASSSTHAFDSGCTWETDYYCVRVQPATHQGKLLRVLRLDYLLHSYNDLADPTDLSYGYEKVYAELLDYVARQQPEFALLQLGGGGYTMPRYIDAVYPQAQDLVLEIDPAVTQAAFRYLGLARDTRAKTINLDARVGLQQLPADRRFDVILGDTFHDLAVPFQLTTREFDQQVAAHLQPGGWYLINVIDKLQSGRFLAAMTRTLRSVFPHVYVMADDLSLLVQDDQSTFVVAASTAELDPARLQRVRGQGLGGRVLTRLMTEAQMEAWLAKTQPVLLTDDYAPVDNMLAPLFLDRD